VVSAVDDKRMLIPVLAALAALGAAASSLGAATSPPTKPAASAASRTHPGTARHVDAALTRRLRRNVLRWETVMGRPHVHLSAPLRSRRALVFWRRRARYVRRLAAHPPHRSGWLCIHRYEAGWGDSDDPYWGGLQMDRGFMRTYAPPLLLRRGWADRWTILEQMWVAERAHRRGRGFWPWANTAQACGLI
jgi:hypothetical protein